MPRNPVECHGTPWNPKEPYRTPRKPTEAHGPPQPKGTTPNLRAPVGDQLVPFIRSCANFANTQGTIKKFAHFAVLAEKGTR